MVTYLRNNQALSQLSVTKSRKYNVPNHYTTKLSAVNHLNLLFPPKPLILSMKIDQNVQLAVSISLADHHHLCYFCSPIDFCSSFIHL